MWSLNGRLVNDMFCSLICVRDVKQGIWWHTVATFKSNGQKEFHGVLLLSTVFQPGGKYSMNANPSLVTDCVQRWKMKEDSTREEIKRPAINHFQNGEKMWECMKQTCENSWSYEIDLDFRSGNYKVREIQLYISRSPNQGPA